MPGARTSPSRRARFARVAVPVPVDRLFTYSIPDDMADDVFVGCRVDVPFGKRMLSGVVAELCDRADVPRVRPIRRRGDTWLSAPMLDLARWIARYYGCTLGEAVQSVLPPSVRGARVERRPGGIVRVTDARLREGGETSPAMDAARRTLGRARRQVALLVDLVRAGGDAPLGAVTGEWGYSRRLVDQLEARGLVAVVPEPERESRLAAMDERVVTLTDAQRAALERIDRAIASRAFSPVLLFGVTGSGKTEVYLRAAQRALDSGGGCIVLVPEIGLIPQATARYRRMFGHDVAIVHSRLRGPQRYAIWKRVMRGECRLVIGPRSAVFMPVHDLRLIVVDEEQDDSYKQDVKPRYHARAVALMRGRNENLTVVLGSATPSAESFHHARRGRYAFVRLPDRPGGSPLPRVTVVDMRHETVEGREALFSRTLVERIGEAVDAGRQVIVYLNRRGHARVVMCRSCGWAARCEHCDITLTFHRVDRTLRCHFCGFRRRAVEACEACGSNRLAHGGVGTQRVELELQSILPGIGVLRMDADTTAGRDGHRRILEEFAGGRYPVLLGTQMVTKGHHFPEVSLVGVLSAEDGLNFPDFRAAERTFQTLAQVAGRCGRGRHPGEVVVQTYMPEHYVFRHLVRHDYEGFMEDELALRRRLRFPPFARVVLAAVSAPDAARLHAAAEAWVAALREALGAAIEAGRIDVMGPAPPMVARIQGRYREQILVRGDLRQADRDAALAAWRAVASRPVGRGVDLRWDVDPESFL